MIGKTPIHLHIPFVKSTSTNPRTENSNEPTPTHEPNFCHRYERLAPIRKLVGSHKSKNRYCNRRRRRPKVRIAFLEFPNESGDSEFHMGDWGLWLRRKSRIQQCMIVGQNGMCVWGGHTFVLILRHSWYSLALRRIKNSSESRPPEKAVKKTGLGLFSKYGPIVAMPVGLRFPPLNIVRHSSQSQLSFWLTTMMGRVH